MEHTQIEIAELKSAAKEAEVNQLAELAEIQLLLVGGGSAEVGFA